MLRNNVNKSRRRGWDVLVQRFFFTCCHKLDQKTVFIFRKQFYFYISTETNKKIIYTSANTVSSCINLQNDFFLGKPQSMLRAKSSNFSDIMFLIPENGENYDIILSFLKTKKIRVFEIFPMQKLIVLHTITSHCTIFHLQKHREV